MPSYMCAKRPQLCGQERKILTAGISDSLPRERGVVVYRVLYHRPTCHTMPHILACPSCVRMPACLPICARTYAAVLQGPKSPLPPSVKQEDVEIGGALPCAALRCSCNCNATPPYPLPTWLLAGLLNNQSPCASLKSHLCNLQRREGYATR